MNRIWEQCRLSMKRGRRRHSQAQPVPVAALEQRTLLAAIVVNSNLDNTTVDAFTTLREAIIQANASPEADTITFGNGQTNFTDATADTITLGGTRIDITDSVTITGLAANKLSISGNNLSQVFYVNGSAAPGTKVVTIQGVTLTGGNALGGASVADSYNTGNFGGALLNNRATLNLRGVAVTGNQATAAIGGNGGGGLYNWLDAASVMNIADSTISGNSSGNGDGGGGIMNWTGILTIQNSTVSGNTTTGTGGGIKSFYTGASLTATNVTITGNTAVSGGGISANASSVETLRNTIVAGNISSAGSTANDITGTIDTASNNLIGDAATAGGITNGASGNLVGNSGAGTRAIATILNTTLADNGGPTRTHQLVASSAAINAGSNASVIGPTATLANLLQPGNFIAAGSTQYQTFTPYNALDNNPSTFSHTEVTDTNSSWTIKLSRDQEIRQVVLTNRNDSVPGRFRDITVQVLDVNGLVVYTSPVLNPRATAGNNVLVGPPTLTATLPNGITGRTIRVSRLAQPGFGGSTADENVLSLAEVGVLGIPLSTDQRGGFFDRIVGGAVDIGAVESQDFAGADAADPDDQISEAPLVPMNTTLVQTLSRLRDVDLYAFDVVAGQTVTFDIDFQQLTGWMNDSVLRIFDSAGVEQVSNDDGVGPSPEPGANGWESFISRTFPTAGRFYIGVSAFRVGGNTYNATTGDGDVDSDNEGLYQLAISSPNTPPIVSLTNTIAPLAENTSTVAAIRVADILITDDGVGTNTLSLTGADAASFEIVGNQLFLKAGVSLNFEVKTSYNVTVNVDDTTFTLNPDSSTGYVLGVTNVQEAPTFTGGTTFSFEEFSARWTNIGKLNATDPEGNALTYSIVSGNPDGTLTIGDGSTVATGGQLYVFQQDLTGLRHRGMFNLRVRVTDNGPGNLFTETDVKIFITPSPNGTTRIDPSANGDVTDINNDGFGSPDDEAYTGDGNLIVSAQPVPSPITSSGPSRGIMEFNLASQPTNRVLKSAWIFFTAQNLYDLNNDGTANVPIDVYGYAGNGAVDAADATAGIKIGSRTINNTGGTNQLKVHAAQLDTNYVRTLIGSGQLGLALRNDSGVDGINLINTRTAGALDAQKPYLVLQYGDLPPDIVVRDQGATGTGNAFVTLKSDGAAAFTVNTANVFAAGSWERFLTGDFNADGRTDIAGRLSNNGQWWVSLANASGVHQAATQWGSWGITTWNDVQVADFNGDGRADIAGRLTNGDWWVSSSTGTTLVAKLWGNWSPGNTWTNATVGDFNRDGLMDIAGRNNLGEWHVSASTGATPATRVFTTSQWGLWSTGTVWADVQIGDFNGDGRTDIAGRSSLGQWWVNRSTGTSFAAALYYGNWATGTTWSDVRVADFNGDGRDDILGRTSIGQWWVAETAVTPSFTMKLMGTRAPVQSQWGEMVVGDFNRDGRADIATRNNLDNSVWVSLWTITGNTPSFTTSSWGNLPTVGSPLWRLQKSGRLNG